MKSALELAMEKTAAVGAKAREELAKLSPAQRQEVEKIKKVYEGKIAEKDVMFQQEAMKLTGGVPLDMAARVLPPEAQEKLAKAHEKFKADKEALEAERDEKIETMKKGG
ncbi:MAG: hypothetical protein A3J27_02000 [Candidatus Tectomicrobia bacterium RIFCSPLOWO2_12_FULL_69_37]|nr:MAG: hypothetical protein A3I72_09025 [Candidatus Tectomicrobia bacterium RIFCSPLOWO2_02_FULL_70_19]OGL65668.1 MAG: hypothetical protein A3J27_02000 [Candidatus Tectomicrobia bacterium RIFCSPLOWO2_12_FULL_69_37]